MKREKIQMIKQLLRGEPNGYIRIYISGQHKPYLVINSEVKGVLNIEVLTIEDAKNLEKLALNEHGG